MKYGILTKQLVVEDGLNFFIQPNACGCGRGADDLLHIGRNIDAHQSGELVHYWIGKSLVSNPWSVCTNESSGQFPKARFTMQDTLDQLKTQFT